MNAIRAALKIVGGAMMLAWVALPMLGDWFAATGSAVPRADTGQVYFVKGIQVGGYGTAQEASFLKLMALSLMSLLVGLAGAAKLFASPEMVKHTFQLGKITCTFWILWFALLLGGGHWIALVLTGSWSLPNRVQP